MAESIRRVVKAPDGRRRGSPVPVWCCRCVALHTTFRELREMRYLLARNRCRWITLGLTAVLGPSRTPADEAVEATLVGLGACPRPMALDRRGRPYSYAVPAQPVYIP